MRLKNLPDWPNLVSQIPLTARLVSVEPTQLKHFVILTLENGTGTMPKLLETGSALNTKVLDVLEQKKGSTLGEIQELEFDERT